MSKFRICTALGIALHSCLPLLAQESESQPPLPLESDRPAQVQTVESAPDVLPRTFVEQTSPATFGAAILTGDGNRLVVQEVVPGSLAAEAGLEAGDSIVSMNGRFVTEPEQFNAYVASHPADRIRIVVIRDGVEQTLIVNPQPVSTSDSDARPALGIRFHQANRVILNEVLPNSPGERAGLRPGDHIISVDETTVASTDHFISLIAAAPVDSDLELLIVRGDHRHTISVKPQAWENVFESGRQYTTLKPALDSTPGAATYVAPSYYYAPVSPVAVPPIAFNTYHGYPYGYTSWVYPYCAYCGYYGYWGGAYYHPNWYLYTWPGNFGPFPGHPGPRKIPASNESARYSGHADQVLAVERNQTGDSD